MTAWSINKSKTHCKRGHEFTSANTWIDGDGSRRCRACNALYQARRRRSQVVAFRLTDMGRGLG